MEWAADGLLLASRPHGEAAAIIDVFTEAQGRHSGVVRGGTGRRLAPVLQPGNQLQLVWRARLGEHLGHFTVEPLRTRAACLLADPPALAAMSSVCALVLRGLPERAPDSGLYRATIVLADTIGTVADWPLAYLRWELGLLAALGFGLDLARCAVTGATDGLAFVSPRTGRAVTAAGAAGWEDRLLPLPAFLVSDLPPGQGDVGRALDLTGHFLSRILTPDGDPRPLPEARVRLCALLARIVT